MNGYAAHKTFLATSVDYLLQRISRGILNASGNLNAGQAQIPFTPPTLQELCSSLDFEEDETRIVAALKYMFEGKKKPKATTAAQRCSAPVLRTLCLRYANDPSGTKVVMAQRLVSDSDTHIARKFLTRRDHSLTYATITTKECPPTMTSTNSLHQLQLLLPKIQRTASRDLFR